MVDEKQSCVICGNPVDGVGAVSDVAAGKLCSVCHGVERRTRERLAAWSIAPLVLWFILLFLRWRGATGWEMFRAYSLALGVWFLVCIWITYRRVRRRAAPRNGNGNGNGSGNGSVLDNDA
jgi:hypothetical protein